MNSDELPIVPSEDTSGDTAAETPDAVPLAMPSSEDGKGSALPPLGKVQQIQQQQVQDLSEEIAKLKAMRSDLQGQVVDLQRSLGRMVQDTLSELEQRKQTLQLSIEQLERRQERIRGEMRTNFAGASQDIAIRVQSFKDYLVGSLQDLAIAADQLELQKAPMPVAAPTPVEAATSLPKATPTPQFAEENFKEEGRKIRSIIEQFRNEPDYYGPVWKLRRTFEAVHAERVTNWFFTQGGKGAVRTMGSRLQNILVAAAAISILYNLHRDRVRTLILANSPERLGEWRRGLQDCLGVSRSDFGSDRGISLFETPERLALKAEQLEKEGLLPLIVIDETEETISLALLQFPLWLAFAPNPQQLIQQQSYFY